MGWDTHYQTGGTGHLYQGRFKSFPLAADEHLDTVLRYVERNPLRAGLVQRAESWRLGSRWRRRHPDARPAVLLHTVFCDRKGGFLRRANVWRWSYRPAPKRAGLPLLKPYAFRHTSATLLCWPTCRCMW
jgi:hypothetical protein